VAYSHGHRLSKVAFVHPASAGPPTHLTAHCSAALQPHSSVRSITNSTLRAALGSPLKGRFKTVYQ
jgi:hypothetical protein